MLARITGRTRMAVNSAHHQAVKSVGAGLLVNATAADGLIEGIEAPAHRFALGVQWRYAVDAADPLILRAFVPDPKCRRGLTQSAVKPQEHR